MGLHAMDVTSPPHTAYNLHYVQYPKNALIHVRIDTYIELF